MLVLTSEGSNVNDDITKLTGFKCCEFSCKRQGGKQIRSVKHYWGIQDQYWQDHKKPYRNAVVSVGIFTYGEIQLIFKWEKEFETNKFIDFSKLKGCSSFAHGTQVEDKGYHLNPFSPPKGPWDIYYNQPYGSILYACYPSYYERLYMRVFGKWSRDSKGKNSCVMYMGANRELNLANLRDNGQITYIGDKVQKNLQKLVTGTASYADRIMDISMSPWISPALTEDRKRREYISAFESATRAVGLGLIHLREFAYYDCLKLKVSNVLDFIAKYKLPRRVELFSCRGLKNGDQHGRYKSVMWHNKNNEGYSIMQALQLQDTNIYAPEDEESFGNNMERIHQSYNAKNISLDKFNKNIKIIGDQKATERETLNKIFNNFRQMQALVDTDLNINNDISAEQIYRSSIPMKNLEGKEGSYTEDFDAFMPQQQQQMYQKDRSLSPPHRNALMPQKQIYQKDRSLSPPHRNALMPQQQNDVMIGKYKKSYLLQLIAQNKKLTIPFDERYIYQKAIPNLKLNFLFPDSEDEDY
jgi:hypothetical protein